MTTLRLLQEVDIGSSVEITLDARLIGPTRGCRIGERLEQPIEHRLGRNPRVTRRAVPALSLFFGVIHQLSSL